ncbi:MAG: DNA repair protein RadC [Chthonomonadaceae bacterium]|jgi:DNA repair protein RadC|nr:DNA repair protein RadC [Chthonomonadaceae bacterium]
MSGTLWARVQQNGVEGVSATDLLTLMATRRCEDLETNEPEVRTYFQGYPVARYKDLSPTEFAECSGLDLFESIRLLAAIELGRRAGASNQGPKAAVTDAQKAFELFRHLENRKQEHFCAAFFDSKAQLIAQKTIHVGTLNMSVVGSREVFREAVRCNAASLIVGHNHPSGDPEPSPEDIEVTKRLIEAGSLLDTPLMDHIIVGHDGKFVSLCERGHL